MTVVESSNDCLYEILMAKKTMDEYVEESVMDLFTESESDLEAVDEKNKKVVEKSNNFLITAIKKLGNMIKSAIQDMGDFIKRLFLSKEQKQAFEEFKKMCASDPELASKKVTVKDFKAYQEAYDKAIKDIEDARDGGKDVEYANEILNVLQYRLDELGPKASSMGKKAVTSVSSDMLLKLAKDNQTAAKVISATLGKESAYLKMMEDELGAKRAEKFADKIQKEANRKITFSRILVKLHIKKQNTLQSVMKDQVSSITNIVSAATKPDSKNEVNKALIKAAIKNRKVIEDTTGMSTAQLAGEAYKVNKDYKKVKNQAISTFNDVKSLFKK